MRRATQLAPLSALVFFTLTTTASAIETVVVTAERRPEVALDVPITVTALSGDTLHEDNINNALNLEELSPGLTVAGNLGSSDNAVFSIRGQNQPFGGADPGVQTYFAEVPFNAGGAGMYYDMDNVQVLEGPQGTLFGKSTTGGAVLFEPKRPTDKFEAYLDAQGGDFKFGQLQGAVNIPIMGDTLDLRVAGEIERRDGYTTDMVFNGGPPFAVRTDNIDNEGVRVGLTWRPTNYLQNYLVFDGRWDRTHGTGDQLTAIASPASPSAVTLETLFGAPFFDFYYFGTGSCVPPPQPGLVCALGFQQSLGPRTTTSTITPRFRRDDYGITDIAEWDITDHLRLRNIAAYRNSKYQPSYDYDGSYLPILEIVNGRTWQTDSTQITEEFHFLGETPDNVWRWLAGFYYEDDYPGGYAEIERQAFGGSANAPLGSTVFQDLTNSGNSKAVFGQASYDVSEFVPGLTLTAGGRYTWDTRIAKEADCEDAPPFFCPFPIPSAFALPTQIGHFSAFSWTLAADYAIDDETRAYVTGRRGYKSGGFNSGGFGLGFQPEFLTDVEIGVKHAGTILGVPATLNADAYYGWYNNIQKNDFAFEGVVPFVVTYNAGSATIKGFELSTVLKPAELLDLSAFYAYTDASYGVFNTFFLPGSHKGDPFVYTPRNKFGATGRLWLPVDPAWGKPSFSATVYYQSRVWFSDVADVEPDSSQSGYALVNLRLDWNSICNSNLDAAVFVDNVGNQLYKTGANPLEHLTLTTSSMFAPPRMWSVELRYHVD